MKEIKIPEMTYVQIAEPFGKQVREMIQKAYSEGHTAGYDLGKAEAKFEAGMERIAEVTSKVGPFRLGECKVESPQEKRDRIVEQAKADINGLKRIGPIGKYYRVMHDSENMVCEADFVINKGKRTVSAIMRGWSSGKVYARGIAKCSPGDCFNVHIGESIALHRALGLEVPAEYLNVPNPTEVRVGDVVKVGEQAMYAREKITTVVKKETGAFGSPGLLVDEYTPWRTDKMTWVMAKHVDRVIDDSREGVKMND